MQPLRDLLFVILPDTPSLDPWEDTLTSPIGPCHNSETRLLEICTENFTEVKKTFSTWRYDQWKMLTFCWKWLIGWNQGFWKNVFKAFQTPKNGSRPCYTLREALGGPGDVVEAMMNAFYWHLKIGTLSESDKKHQKWPFLIDDCEGPNGRTVIYQVVEALPTDWEPFWIVCSIGRRRQHIFLKTPKSRLH